MSSLVCRDQSRRSTSATARELRRNATGTGRFAYVSSILLGLPDAPGQVVVRTYQNRFEADVARTALDAAGIESMLRSDDYGGRGPNLTLTQGIEILVRAEDARDADAILSIDLTGGNSGYLPE